MLPEPGHAAIEAAFRVALSGDAPPDGITSVAPEETARRFAVYRNNVHHSLGRALAARFPVVEQLVGQAFFAALARAFVARKPPRNPVLMHWGGEFAEFLDGFPPVAGLPWLGDVARLEFARGQASHAADAAPLSAARLGAGDPAALCLVLHPSVRVFASRHPVVSIWAAHQPGATPLGKVSPGPEFALIGRQQDFTVIVEPLDHGTHAVIAALALGMPLGHAAAEADPTTALTLLLRHELITDITTGASE